ncbi:MAG: hypothetical protein K2X93_21120 [Candidatus Obscuribacterales bacterium]|nr:hypothetical protein [Candidatus Obscuribacterales bacterium]
MGNNHSRLEQTPPQVMAGIPATIRRSQFSIKTSQAIVAVNTPSKLSNNEAVDANDCAKPNSEVSAI